MIGTILLFEVQQRLSRISTWIYCLILVGLGYLFAVVVGGGIGNAAADFGGKVYVNSPFALNGLITQLSLLGLIITASLAGQATYQDIDNNCDSFFYTAPIRKIDYLAGRFLGVLVTQLVIFAGVGIGLWLGLQMPFLDPAKIGPERLMAYLQPYLILVIPNLVFLTALFFCLAALGRKMLPIYAGSVVLLIGYLIVGTLLQDPTKSALYALADPFGSRAAARLTQYWTPFERNTQLIPLSGVVLLNRILWLSVSAALCIFTYFKFSRSQALSRGRKQGHIGEEPATAVQALPEVKAVFSFRASFFQCLSLTWLQFTETVKNVFFSVILVAGFLFALLIANAPTDFLATPFYPVTSRVVQLVIAGFALFETIIIVFYSGELVWRERDAKVSQIMDAMPAQRWVFFASKLGALMLVQVIVVTLIMAAGLTVQILRGYFHFEFGVYLKELFLIELVQNCIICALALLIHTVVNHKFLGYFAVIMLYIGIIDVGLPQAGFEHYLVRYGHFPQHVYSDMNGYSLYVKPLFWFELYWALAAVLLAVACNLMWVRGIEGGVKLRLKLGLQRLTPASRAGLAAFALLFAATGSYIFYNTNILNRYVTTKRQQKASAEYEKKYRQYLDLPQPRITDVQTMVDLYPEERSATVRGTLWMENKTPQTIDRVALTLPVNKSKFLIHELSFAGGQTPLVQDNELGFHLYRLNSPLAPGGRIPLKFAFRFENPGFSNTDGDTRVVQNGSFLNNSYVPYVGYRATLELGDDTARRRNGLDKVKRMPKLEDVSARQNNYISPESDWINFETTFSTTPDQIAIAPGYLQKDWTQDGRRYFQYKMDAPILDFYSFNSGRYQVRRDRWNDVNLEIYYQPGHEFNLDRMQRGMKETLAYCSANFSPFQFHQLRIIEFPRYAGFAQSFANTVPFSEAIGFITRVDPKKPDAIDLPFYVTSHETAHQWWGHQEVAANVEGATSLVETLAQYTALMVMKHHYGPEAMKKFLQYELRNYLRLRGLERNDEKPLYRVEAGQTYIHYQKGSLVMYALQDYIGEDKVNQALSEFVKAYAFKGAPYATSQDLLGYLRKVTPEDQQYILEDLFEHITLYESRAVSATYKKQPDGKYQVHLAVEFKKYRADSRGDQHQVPAHDWLDIGVLDAQGNYLYLQKQKIEKDKTDFTLVVDKLPAQAGIDPLNKMIDRDPNNNLIKVTEAN